MVNLPSPTSRTYDNTRVAEYKFCPRKYLLRHVLHWTRTGTAAPLVFGSSWHAGMDMLWPASKELKNPADIAAVAYDAFMEKWVEEGFPAEITADVAEHLGARTPMIAKEMFYNYAVERKTILSQCTILAIEQPFAVPMPGLLDTWFIGKLDKVIEWQANRVVIEHKSTTAYSIALGFISDWTESWYSSPQVKGYEFGGQLYYPGLDGVWVDGALVHKKQHNTFRFIPVKHQMPLLVEWLEDTRNWILRIEDDTTKYRSLGSLKHGIFPKNEDNCFGKFGTCPFLDICRHTTDPTQLDGPPSGYTESHWEPFSVLGLDKLVAKTRQGEDK